MTDKGFSQEQIDRIMSGKAKLDDVARELTEGQSEVVTKKETPEKTKKSLKKEITGEVLSNGSETNGERDVLRSRLRRSSLRIKPNVLHVRGLSGRTVVIGQDKRDYERETSRSYLPEECTSLTFDRYALFTFDLRRGGIEESINLLFRSLIGRVLGSEHKHLARDGNGLLVAKIASVRGVYEVFRSEYRSKVDGALYEHRVIDEIPEDEEGFVERLEDTLKGYTASSRLLPVYSQKELRADLCAAMSNLEVSQTVECDLGSFPREERKRY